ncbi:alpha/beta fold hydrolase [Sphingorhabdus arenilitoris]|uniref:Alpha/beta fold hydrolase n=1 Tax=Sphingorhabdus arenilitoris TaxID=1490041 RepID=A0ABV8RIS4_9SPHN
MSRLSFLSRLGLRLDTKGARNRMAQYKNGWPAQSSPDIKFYRSPLVQYRYREQGEGPVIVFTADPPVTLELYDELLAIFSARFRLIVVELPAMGFSAADKDYTFGFRETNDDLALFLKDVAGEGAILAFSCVAGLAAVDLAVRRSKLVSKLVLMQTGDGEAFARWKTARDPKGILARPIIGQWIMKRLAPKRMPDWYRLSVGNRDKIDHFCSCAQESFDHGALWSLASAYQVYMDPSVALPAPKQPILATWGLADRSHPPVNAKSPMNFSSNVTYVAFNDLGHFAELEDTKRLFSIICTFVDG